MAKPQNRIWRNAASALLLGLAAQLANGQSLLEAAPPLQFVEQVDWTPFTPQTPGITQQGLAYELLQLLFSQLDQRVQLELLPLAQVQQQLKSGQADGISITQLDERRITYLAYSEPLLLKRAFIYYPTNNPVPAQLLDWDSGQNLRLGVVKNRSFGPKFRQQRSQLPMELVEVDSLEQLFKLTREGTLNGFLAYELNANSLLTQPAYQGKISRMPQPYYEGAYYLAVGRHSTAMALLPKIDQAIGQLRENGQLAALLKKYGARD